MIKKKKNKIIDDDMPIGPLVEVQDFLPPPHELVFTEPNIKVTLELSKASVDFFKREAKKHNTKYQRMIRALIDRYAKQF